MFDTKVEHYSKKKWTKLLEIFYIVTNHFRLSLSSIPQAITGFPLSQVSQSKSDNLLEDQGKPRKLEFFRKKLEKSQGRIFLSMQFFNFNKKIICTQKYVELNCIRQSVLYMMLLFASSIKMI